MKNIFGHIIILTVFLTACNSPDKSSIDSLYRADLRDKIKLLQDQLQRRVEDNKRYRGYDLEFYVKTQEAILELFKSVDNGVLNGADSKQKLISNYQKQVADLNKFCNALRKNKKYFHPNEVEKIKINKLDSTTLLKIQDDTLLKLILISDLKTQLNEISFQSHNFGCHMTTFFKNGNFHDFFIFQATSKDNNTCTVTIKNNYLTEVMGKEHYNLSFKSIKKINGEDTLDVNTKVVLNELKNSYKTNEFTLEKGTYNFNTELKLKKPDGTIKFGEMTFEFEIK